MRRMRWWLAPALAVPVIVVVVLLLGPLAGFLIAGSLLVALPLLLRRSAAPRPGPGAAGPGQPGYAGNVHVGDDPGLVD